VETLSNYSGSDSVRQAVASAVQERGEHQVTLAFREHFQER
jgi:hypothetical protein